MLERYSLWAAGALVILTAWAAPFIVLSHERVAATAKAEQGLGDWATKEKDWMVKETGYQSQIRDRETRIGDLKQEGERLRSEVTQQIENLRAENRTLLGAVVKPPPVPLVPIDLRVIPEHFSPTEFPDRPHRTVVTIQTNRRIQPTKMRIVFDGPISLMPAPRMVQPLTAFYLVGSSGFQDVTAGVVNGNTFELQFAAPAFTPQGPLILTVLSRESVNVLRVER